MEFNLSAPEVAEDYPNKSSSSVTDGSSEEAPSNDISSPSFLPATPAAFVQETTKHSSPSTATPRPSPANPFPASRVSTLKSVNNSSVLTILHSVGTAFSSSDPIPSVTQAAPSKSPRILSSVSPKIEDVHTPICKCSLATEITNTEVCTPPLETLCTVQA